MLAGVLDGRHDGHAGRAADQQAFLACESTGHFEGFGIVHLHDLVRQPTVEGLGIEVLADAFDLVLVHVVGIGIDGAFRIGSDDLHGSVGNVLQVSAGAGDGAAGADAGHEMRDLMVGGLPDFRAGGVVVAFRAVRIVILVRAIAAGNRLGEAFGHLIIGTRVVRTGVGGGHDHFGPIGAQYGTLGFGDLVGQGEDGTVTALLRHQSQTYAGVAGGRLHDHPAGL